MLLFVSLMSCLLGVTFMSEQEIGKDLVALLTGQ